MSFPHIQKAIAIATRGVDFTVTAADFRVAQDIWGSNIASLKGKTRKMLTNIAELSIDSQIVQREQILSVDIMYVEGIPSLTGLATPLDLTMGCR